MPLYIWKIINLVKVIYNGGITMSYVSSIDDDDDIVLTIKKSDVKKITDGKQNFNVKVFRNAFGNNILNRMKSDSEKEENIHLTIRELEVLKYLIQGKSNIIIANELKVSKHTIKAHVANILQKLEVNGRFEAAIKAIKEKIV